MKQSLMGALVGAGVILAGLLLFGLPGEANAQRTAVREQSSELITHATPTGDGSQQITVIDPKIRAMSVYHIDAKTGAISLQSARNITFDLQVVTYKNGVGPTPQDIRSQLESQ